MDNRERKIELLAPAGSFESVKAAITAGADAVYMGGSRFGARAFADSVQEDCLAEAIDYVHLHGKKLYLTVNTLLKEKELEEELLPFLRPYYQQGLDGVIVQDLGVFSYLKKYFPELPLHASTQMTVTGIDSAKLLQSMGAKRVVAARELSLKEIADIYNATQMEVEAFVHGAVCYCYSGQCLYSSLIGGRSGNRGQCAQPCRLPYTAEDSTGKRLNHKKENYLLSLKDMCTLQSLPQLIEAGVMSFKIEGRMKSPVYTAGVVHVYRKYIDQYLQNPDRKWKVQSEDLKLLSQLFDRGGFSEQYLHKHNGKEMLALYEKPEFRTIDAKMISDIEQKYIQTNLQEKISGNVTILTDSYATITLRWAGHEAKAQLEDVVLPAKNKPLTEEIVLKQMHKTGQTPYIWGNLDVELSDNAFLPVQQLNTLRRKGLEELEKQVKQQYYRSFKQKDEMVGGSSKDIAMNEENLDYKQDMRLSVSIVNVELLPVVLQYPQVDIVMFELAAVNVKQLKACVHDCHKQHKSCYLLLPFIFRQTARKKFTEALEDIKASGIDGLVVRNMDEAGFLASINWPLPVQFDYSFYIWNQEARNCVKDFMIKDVIDSNKKWLNPLFTAPLELNNKELEAVNCKDMEIVAYGYLPMMVSAGCIHNTITGCDHKEQLIWLKDRKNQRFPVSNFCKYCYNVIYNSVPLSLLDRTKAIRKLHVASVRAAFTIETPQQADVILQNLIQAFKENKISQLDIPFTRGHFARGVK